MPLSDSLPTTGDSLIDAFGRQIEYVRLSATDRCDFRCTYCMAEEMTFLPRQEVLSLEELERVARIFIQLGVKKLRITGGEPLIRRGVDRLFTGLCNLPGLQELAVTTNGSQLVDRAQHLRDSGVTSINISLDTLDPRQVQGHHKNGRAQYRISRHPHSGQCGFRSHQVKCRHFAGAE